MRRAIVIAAAVAAGGCPGGEHVVVRTVLSRTGAPMAGIRVQVEEQPWKTTGADGRATFDGVPGRVTVRVHQSFARDGDLAYAVDQVQVLRGRTGREIVAEVGDPGPVLFHGARVTGTVTGRFGPPSTVLYVGVAYQDWAISMPIAGDGSFDWGVPWRGGESATEATVTMRAWESDAASPPGHYYGFGSTSVHLYELRDIPTVVSLSLAPVTDGVVQGTVMVPPALPDGFVYSFLTLAFSRYESLPLASIPSTPGPFTLTVPSVPGADPWINVQAGQCLVQSFHNRRIAVPSTGLVFQPPLEPELIEPAAGAAIGDPTVFRWSPPEPGGSSTLSFWCEWMDAVRGHSFVGYAVEAEGIEATLPAIPDVSVPPGAACTWFVFWCAATDPSVEQRCSWSAERSVSF